MSNEGKTPRSFRRYLLETTAVLSGILIAFGLDAGWGLLREGTELRESLSTLSLEFSGTRAQFDSVLAVNERALRATDEFIRMTAGDLAELSEDSLATLAVGLIRADTFDPGESALAALVAGNILERVPDGELRGLIAGWSGRVNDLREEQAEVRRSEAAIRQHLAMSALLVPPLGATPSRYSRREQLRLQIEDVQTRQLYAVRQGAVRLMLREQTGLSEAADRILALLEVATR